MNKAKVTLYMFLTIIGGVIFVGSQAWEWKNFIKGDFGAVETHGGSLLQFVDKEGNRVALADFAATMEGQRQQLERNEGLWFMSTETLPDYSVAEVQAGFLANPDLLIRTQMTFHGTEENLKDTRLEQSLNKAKHKEVLTRAESEKMLAKAEHVVEGANLIRNEYGSKLFANFFFFITGFHGFHVLTGILLNVIVFFNVLTGTYEKRGSYEMVEKVGLYWHFVDLVWVFVFTFFYLV